jgi:hypothetical protein
LFAIVKTTFLWILVGSQTKKASYADSDLSERTHLLNRSDGQHTSGNVEDQEENDSVRTSSSDALSGWTLINEATGKRKFFWDWTLKLYRKRNAKQKAAAICFLLLSFAVYVLWIFVGIVLLEKTKTGRAALLKSDHCGLWQMNRTRQTGGAATADRIRRRKKESMAGEYACDCYDDVCSPHADRSNSACNFFYRPSLPFREDLVDCPFPDVNVCAPDHSAIKFYTDYINTGDIGVNAKNSFRFRRTATCAALNIDPPYVETKDVGGQTEYYYNYGTQVNTDNGDAIIHNWTFSTIDHPINWLVPFYDVKFVPSSLFPKRQVTDVSATQRLSSKREWHRRSLETKFQSGPRRFK